MLRIYASIFANPLIIYSSNYMGITKLNIKNFAIIRELRLEFSEGLNMFTGETGAGKSIIVEAIGFLFGERAYSEMIREGEASMEIEGEFLFDKKKLKGILPGFEGETLVIKRIFDASGRTRAYMNGRPCLVASLSAAGRAFADFHGQNQSQSLMAPEKQLAILDRYAGLDGELKAFSTFYSARREVESRIRNISLSKEEKERLMDLYSFQAGEIEKIDPKEGEDAELEDLISRFKNIDKIEKSLNEVYSFLKNDDSSALHSVYRALARAESLAQLDPSFSGALERLEKAKAELEDLAELFYSSTNNPDRDPGKLDFYIGRAEKIKALKKKYGETVSLVRKKGEELKAKVGELENVEHSVGELQKELEVLNRKLSVAGEALSGKRAVAAKKLSKEIEKELKELGFEYARFSIKLESDPGIPSGTGFDSVEFLFSSNPDQFLKPLKFIASGGEISRVMLAAKSALSAYDELEMLVFDEIDSGVGGNTIFAMGEKLKAIAVSKQILCITHMAQLAAFADANFKVEKNVSGGKTEIKALRLDPDGKSGEIARMLGSSHSSKTAVEHAKQLINNAKKRK